MGLAVGPDPRARPRLAPARLDGSPARPGQRSLSQASRRRAGRGFPLGAVRPDEPNAWLAALTAVDPLGLARQAPASQSDRRNPGAAAGCAALGSKKEGGFLMQPCSLLSLATAVPPHVVAQDEAKALARDAFSGKKGLFDRLSGVFDNAGIAKRHIVAPQEWYATGHGWRDRNAVYLEAAEQMFVDAALKAIERAGLEPRQIDGIVTVSTTGIATPRLEGRVMTRVGVRQAGRRGPVFGLGCAGGVNGLSLASRLASSDPGSNWLFVTVETCPISIRLDSDDPAAVVATAL